jgi:hypothetical protein
MNRRPVCPALLVCDRVTIDDQTGRIDVFGMFDGRRVPTLPAELAFVVSFAVTDGQGEYEFELSVEHEPTGDVIGTATSRWETRAPGVVGQHAIPMGLRVTRHGWYTVRLRCDAALIAQRTFSLVPEPGRPAVLE